jgi:hypothetical protein
MSNRSKLAVAAALTIATAACVPKAAKYDPFKVPREQFYGSLRVVALAPVQGPSDLEDKEVLAKFQGTIETALAESGLRVILPGEVGPILDSARAKQGGIFDPMTGKRDEERAKAAKAAALAELKARFGADALLRAYLDVRAVRFSADTARWDGVEESVATSGWKKLLVSHSGRVPALSVIVALDAMDGRTLYLNGGGLHVIQKIDAAGRGVPVPQKELFGDDARNWRAVRLAIDPLLGRQSPPPPQ